MAYSFPDSTSALLHDLLAVSLTGVNLLRPLYGPGGELHDFALEYLNPAAQRMTGLSEQPGGTTRTRFPDLFANGVFDFYQRVFETGEAGSYNFNYQADGFDNYFRVAARRSGELLVVSFTDTADQDRSPVELALRASQAREQTARADAEAQRQRFYEVLQQLPALIATYRGPDHVYNFVNPTYQRYFLSQAQLLGRSIWQVLPEAEEQGVFALMDRVYQTGKPYYVSELEVWLDFTGGAAPRQQVFLNLLLHPLRDAQGQVDGLLDFSYDVTEQVLARRQVQQLNQELETRVQERTQQVQALHAEAARAHAYLERVFRQAPIMVNTQLGPEHVFDLVHPLTYQLLGHRQLVGLASRVALPELEGPFHELLDRVYQTGEPFQGTAVPARLDRLGNGELDEAYFDFTYQPLYDAAGQVEGVITFAIEVTEQVLVRQQREAAQRQLHELFEQAPVAIAIFRGPQYVIELANPAMCALWGRTQAQALGRLLFELLPEAAGQDFERLLDQVMATGVPHVATELPSTIDRHGRREVVYSNFVYQPLREDGRDQITAVTVVAIEVTEQVLSRQRVQDLNDALQATNTELSSTNQQLTRTNVDLDTFVYTASHDLKAPITNIEGILLALRAHLPAEVQRDELVANLLDMLQRTVSRFQLTISQLTDISKLQLAHMGPVEPVVLATVVEDVCLDLVPALQAAETQLTVEIAPELVVSFSPANLRSIVYNLLSNAIKYRAPHRPSQVLVRAEQLPQAVIVTVQDNGLGLSEAQQRQLFGLFQRLHTHVEGTGVGLYISKRLIENAGGTIVVQSQLDAGTTFTVTLPAYK